MQAHEIHTPVRLERCLELLAPALTAPGAVVVDATLGMGGHSEALLEAHPHLTLVGIDRDPQALALAGERLTRFGDRVHLVQAVYDELPEVLEELGIPAIDGILFDLGVSSLQLDADERGFAYSRDAALDMRMNPTEGETAADLLARLSESELARVFRDYGDEKLADRYASHIVAARAKAPITRSGQLVEVLQQATPAKFQHAGHPAKRVFQALRVVVNDELGALRAALPAALAALRMGGRVVVMAYQSHEDRLVKQVLRDASSSTAPADLPAPLPEHEPRFRLLTRGAETASEAEQAANPRSIPVRLRAAERVREPLAA